jgi:hypothetical protein
MITSLLVLATLSSSPAEAEPGPGESCRVYQVRKNPNEPWTKWSGFGTYDKVEARMRETATHLYGPGFEFTGNASGCMYSNDRCQPNPCGQTVSMDFGTIR